LVLIPLLLLLIFGGAQAAGWLFAPEMIPVPDLTAKPRARATAIAKEQGLKLEIVGTERTGEVEPGQVISQAPDSGEVEEGSTIEVVVSGGYPKLPVPDVVGLTLQQAEARFKPHKLEVGSVEQVFSQKPEGVVISQSPADKDLPWHSKVNLVVSKGPEPIEVPNVTGMSAADAAKAIEAAGFVPVTVKEYSDDVDEGEVIGTDPPGGQVFGKGGDVRIIVSLGPEFEELKMPDLRGMSLSDAQAKLSGMGLRNRVIQSCSGGSTVVETDPIAGTTVRENDRVALFVC
jgi:serine/threonine-protein kinase